MKLDSYKEVEELTKQLVRIPSINKSIDGENNIANFISDYFMNLDYFKNNPQQIIKVKTKDDVVDRHSIIAYLKGKTNKTIILMGHIDTVDIKDFGQAQENAFNDDKLKDELKELFTLDEEIIDDINSGKYMFGRGALDMKSGVASHMYLMKYFSNHLDELNGNLLFIGECDEEGESLGIISCLDVLNELKQKEGFEYLACLNTDFNTPIDGNDNYAVHIGTIGKLLPCFVAFGKEAHVGKPFDSFDPNLLLSLISKRICYNTDLCDKGVVPPVSLKQMDNKDSYTVQTALSAFGYYNYLMHESSPVDVMNKCIDIAMDAFKEANQIINDNYASYCLKNNLEYSLINYEINVYSYERWYQKLSQENPNFEKDIKEYALKLNKENPDMDLRMFGYKMIEKSYEYYANKKPVVIIFFGTMFYSPSMCNDEYLLNAVDKALETVNKDSDKKTNKQLYYPYISDMSFLMINNKEKEIEEMLNNSPQHIYKYVYPYKKIMNLNVPVVNVGVYGKDGHKFTERVLKDYSFINVPNITFEIIKELLNK